MASNVEEAKRLVVTMAGIWGIGAQPTGDRDPFALRRHALGVGRMLVEADLPLQILPLIDKVRVLDYWSE